MFPEASRRAARRSQGMWQRANMISATNGGRATAVGLSGLPMPQGAEALRFPTALTAVPLFSACASTTQSNCDTTCLREELTRDLLSLAPVSAHRAERRSLS
jgi:hypothetical protein